MKVETRKDFHQKEREKRHLKRSEQEQRKANMLQRQTRTKGGYELSRGLLTMWSRRQIDKRDHKTRTFESVEEPRVT